MKPDYVCHWWNATSLCPPPGWDNLWIPLWVVGSVAAVGVGLIWMFRKYLK